MRKSGIPTVLDRFIQQALLQVLQRDWDQTFSESSHGFRPGRSAHQAITAAQGFIAEGFRWVVDLDLEKFFDRVNHDILMIRIAKRVRDVRLLQLIRAFLNAGVLENGLVTATDEGTPQGGPVSPWLSNVMRDDPDRELERRGLKFARYADDCNICVRSLHAGQRVMVSVSRFLTERLRLTVNSSKSAVDRPWNRKFLGYSLTNHRGPKRCITPKAIERFKDRIRELTRRTRRLALEEMTGQLNSYLRGWPGQIVRCATLSVLRDLNSWLHRRLRAVVWEHWKTSRRRFSELRRLGVSRDLAAKTVGSYHGSWRLSKSPALHKALSTQFFQTLGLATLLPAAPAA